YTVPAITGATGYVWTLPSNVTIVSGANTNSVVLNFSPTASSGNISVYGTNTCGNGLSAILPVTASAIPTVTTTPATSTIACGGGSVSITASGATNYVWSPSTNLSANTGATVNATPSAVTTYSVVGVNAGGCSSTATTIVVNAYPNIIGTY